MILDPIIARTASQDRLSSTNGVSRRRFLQVSAATGGGLMLSLSLPFANDESEATDSFAPNAFIRIDGD
jgi:isoquinoline 1-oxidoreductase beta subunit